MDHWIRAIIFATSIAAYVAALWILFAFARHAHQRILIMLNTGYYWKDAGQILRREKRKEYGPRPARPGQHRAGAPKQHKRATATILSIEDRPPWEDAPEPDIVDALRMVPETDLLGDRVPHPDVTVQRDPTVPIGMAPTDLPDTRTIEMGARR